MSRILSNRKLIAEQKNLKYFMRVAKIKMRQLI